MQEIWITLQKKFDIIQVAEIKTIIFLVINKLFQDYKSTDSYY